MTSIQFTPKRKLEVINKYKQKQMRETIESKDPKKTFLEFVREAKANGDPISLTEALQKVKQEEFERRMAEAKENHAKEINQIGIDLGYTL